MAVNLAVNADPENDDRPPKEPVTWDEPSALEGTRTPNLLIRSQMLYPLSYERLRWSSLEAPTSVRLPESPGCGG